MDLASPQEYMLQDSHYQVIPSISECSSPTLTSVMSSPLSIGKPLEVVSQLLT